MPAGDAPLIVVAQRRARHVGQGGGAWVVGLVDMQVDVEVVAAREGEQPIEQGVEIAQRRAVHRRSRRASRRRGRRPIAPPTRRAGRRSRRGRDRSARATRPAARCGPPIRRACRRRRPSCAPPARAPNRDACGSPIRHAHRRQRRPKLMRRSRSAWVQRRRSAAVAASASPNEPDGLGERTTVWPRSRWVCTSISVGHDLPALQIDQRRRARLRALRPARCARCAPRTIARSNSPTASSCPRLRIALAADPTPCIRRHADVARPNRLPPRARR